VADHQKEIVLAPIKIFEIIEPFLLELEDWPPHQTPDWYYRLWKEGKIEIFQATIKGQLSGVIVFQLEDGDRGRELVILGTYAKSRGIDLVTTLYPWIEGEARRLKCLSIRFETRRRGLVAKMAAHGFSDAHISMRKVLT